MHCNIKIQFTEDEGRNLSISLMQVVCGWYAGGMRVVCGWYAGGIEDAVGHHRSKKISSNSCEAGTVVNHTPSRAIACRSGCPISAATGRTSCAYVGARIERSIIASKRAKRITSRVSTGWSRKQVGNRMIYLHCAVLLLTHGRGTNRFFFFCSSHWPKRSPEPVT